MEIWHYFAIILRGWRHAALQIMMFMAGIIAVWHGNTLQSLGGYKRDVIPSGSWPTAVANVHPIGWSKLRPLPWLTDTSEKLLNEWRD